MDDDSDDVSSIITNSDSDGMHNDEEGVEVSDSNEDKKVDPDYHPIEFQWKIDMTMEMCVQNLAGVDTMISFRAEKHGGGFLYEALEWRTKFTKPNGINHPAKCTFVYCQLQNKLILKNVVK
ncbi:hypothetical protein HanHA300_Chr06g0219311 [Helianthus annuus]|nr:hypothetical protein HanHA300_Chr06g0219311 [Helianthus annuus]KAJ0916121.1 hypothetical protein HanPSC8_Chr06g0257971 [Helianthus annuus]